MPNRPAWVDFEIRDHHVTLLFQSPVCTECSSKCENEIGRFTLHYICGSNPPKIKNVTCDLSTSKFGILHFVDDELATYEGDCVFLLEPVLTKCENCVFLPNNCLQIVNISQPWWIAGIYVVELIFCFLHVYIYSCMYIYIIQQALLV